MKTTPFCALGLLALLGSSCVHGHVNSHPHGMPPGQAKKIAHTHAQDCGHTYSGGTWSSVTSISAAPGHGGKKGKGKHK